MSRWIALAALSEPQLPNGEQIVELLQHRPEGEAAARLSSQTDGAINLSWPAEGDSQGATANVTLIDQPIPWERLEGPCATAWYWPEAESRLRDHSAHLFVTLLDEQTSGIGQATRLTRLLAALGAASPALGLVWGATGAVHEPGAFAQMAASSSGSDLPLHLWIDFRVYQRDDSGFGLFTTGLDALGHREFEVPHYEGDPQHLVGAVYNVTHYLLEKQANLQDSEVIGLPDENQVTIHEEVSMIDPEQEVFRLAFD